MNVTSIRLPAEWRVRVDIAARLQGMTRSQYVRQAVQERAQRDLERLAQGAGRDDREADLVGKDAG